MDRRWFLWLAAFALGVALGAVVYRFTVADFYFDYWIAILLK